MSRPAAPHPDPVRRRLLQGAAGLGLASLAPAGLFATERSGLKPPSVVTQPPRQWGPDAPPSFIPDPDVIALDPSFKNLAYFSGELRRVWTGHGWVEGPAWNSEGRFLLFSNTMDSRQYRYLWETGEVTVFRPEAYHPNGNTYDFEGRQITCEHQFRRVIRWEHDGSATVLADHWGRDTPFNSPNDVVVHRDGSIWFTDPAYGDTLAEGHVDEPGGAANPQGLLHWRLGDETTGAMGGRRRQPDHTFRIDPSGRVDAVLDQSQVADPNGICFSPDYRTLYVVSTPAAVGQQGPGGDQAIHAFDLDGSRISRPRIFADMKFQGVQMNPDGIRADVYGNLWCGASGPLGLCGVFVFNPAGKLIGRIRLPQGCSNLTFGGPQRDHLFMCAAQSLYVLQLETQGAGPA